jgi:hypothetical protein
MRKLDEEKPTEYKRKLKRANTIPGQGIRCINSWSEETFDDLYDYDDEYDDNYNVSYEPTLRKTK